MLVYFALITCAAWPFPRPTTGVPQAATTIPDEVTRYRVILHNGIKECTEDTVNVVREWDALLLASPEARNWVAENFLRLSKEESRNVLLQITRTSVTHAFPEFMTIVEQALDASDGDRILALRCLYSNEIPNRRARLQGFLRKSPDRKSHCYDITLAIDVYLTLYGIADVEGLISNHLHSEGSIEFRADVALAVIRHCPNHPLRSAALAVITETLEGELMQKNPYFCATAFRQLVALAIDIDADARLTKCAKRLLDTTTDEEPRLAAQCYLDKTSLKKDENPDRK